MKKFSFIIVTAIFIAGTVFSCKKEKDIKVTDVQLNKAELTLLIGQTETLFANVLPANATNAAVTWESSNPAVATVVGNGFVTALTPGTATIVASSQDGNKTASCTIIVNDPNPEVKVTDVQLNKAELTLLIGQTETLFANVLPANATNAAVTWESSHPEIATIANGLVTAMATGKTKITVSTEDGNKMANCIVIVKRKLEDSDPEDFGSDDFVSKKQETSTFLFEMLTGIGNQTCPEGHKMADILAASTFSGKFFIINVHGGNYSNYSPPNDLRTDYGDAIRTYSKLTEFPAGMVNRTYFPNFSSSVSTQAPAMNRKTSTGENNWEKACLSIANNQTYVNVAAKTTINSVNRLLTCSIQVYYTSDAPVPINNINIAVLQNEIQAMQSGGSTYYPERIVGDKYRHMHILRHLVTGQWGESIDIEKKKGNLYEKTFTWTISPNIKSITIPVEDIEVLVFITDGNQTVAKVCKSSIEIK